MKALYDTLFTDYGGQVGYAPAVATIAVGLLVCCGLIYGSIQIGKAVYAKEAVIVFMHHT